MAVGAVPGAASVYLRFIIQPTTAPDATPTTGVVATVNGFFFEGNTLAELAGKVTMKNRTPYTLTF